MGGKPIPDPIDNLPNTEAAKRFKDFIGGSAYTHAEFMASWKAFLEGWCQAWDVAEECAKEQQITLRRKSDW